MLEKWLTDKLRKFWMVFNFFWFCLTLSVPEKLKNSIFEMPINPQTLNINNLKTTNERSIKLHTTRKLIEYSLKMFCKDNVYSYVFEIRLSEHRSVLSPAQWGAGKERVKYCFTLNIYIYIYIYVYIYISKWPHQLNFLLSNYDTHDWKPDLINFVIPEAIAFTKRNF